MKQERNSAEVEKARESLLACATAWLSTGNLQDLERCITNSKRLVDLLDTTKADHGMAVIDLCSFLGSRWADVRTDEAWAEAEEVALQWRDRIRRPDWRACLYILAHGLLLYHRASATKAENDISAAIATLEEARQSVRPDSGVHGTSSAYLAELRMVRFDLTQDPVDLESAMQDCEFVLGSKRSRRRDQGLAAVNLARAWLARFDQLHSTEDVDAAVEAAKYAVDLNADGVLATHSHAVLGSALRHRFRLNRDPSDIDAAIDAYHSALRSASADSELSAALTDDLGNCFAERYRSTNVDSDLDEAIACSRRALARYAAAGAACANTRANLGFSLIAFARDRHAPDALDEAIASQQAGLEFQRLPFTVAVRLHNGIAEALLMKHAFSGSAAQLDEAILALEKAFSVAFAGEASLPVHYRLGRHEDVASVTSRLIGALLLRAARNGGASGDDLWRALAIGEAGKVVLLTQELLRRSLRPPKGVKKDLIEWESILLARLAALDAREMASSKPSAAAVWHTRVLRRAKLTSALENAWTEIAGASAEGKAYVEKRRQLPAALVSALDRRPRTRVLLSILEASRLSSDGKWVPGVYMLGLWPESPHPEVVFSASSDAILRAKAQLDKEVSEDQGRGIASETWSQSLAALIRARPAIPAAGIVLSASENATGLPWHVVFERSGWTVPGGGMVPTTLIPSLALLAASKGAPRKGWQELKSTAEHFNIAVEEDVDECVQVWLPQQNAPSRGPLVVGNPTADLDASSNEAVSVGEIVGVRPLLGAEATVAAVETAFAKSPLVHIAAHARFDPDDPLETCLCLADGQLKAHQLIGEWNTARLVVLSACESGANRSALGGELLGFATALLRSGVRSIIASLWPVDDAATRTLMIRFHELYSKGTPVAKALADAMSYVRQQPGWELPYYWASFIVWSNGSREQKTASAFRRERLVVSRRGNTSSPKRPAARKVAHRRIGRRSKVE